MSQPGNNKEGVWDRYQYTKIYNALKDLEEYNVKISVPEFVFIGFQSSGKTSAVSQAAKLAVGVMKHGTASRCPTRFKLISNPKMKKPIIRVNGELCKDEADLTNKTLAITKTYEDKDIFSKDIIEVRIESNQVPELTFVDLPGKYSQSVIFHYFYTKLVFHPNNDSINSVKVFYFNPMIFR